MCIKLHFICTKKVHIGHCICWMLHIGVLVLITYVKNRNKIIIKLKILNGNIEVFSTASSLYTYRSVFSLLYFLYLFFSSFHYCFNIVIVILNITIVGKMISTYMGSKYKMKPCENVKNLLKVEQRANNFCYHKVKTILTLSGAIEKIPIFQLHYLKLFCIL